MADIHSNSENAGIVNKADFTYRQSELHEWLVCRRSTDWKYWQGLTPKHEGPSAASLGTLVHAGLEDEYRRRSGLWMVEGSDAGPPNLYDRLRPLADSDQGVLADIMLRGYWDWVETTGADAGWTIVGVEQQLTARWPTLIHGHTVDVTGKADLLIVDAFGLPRLVDHKTVDKMNDQQPPSDFQRQTYAVLKQILDGETYAGAMHNKLRKVKRSVQAKPPFYGRDEIHFNKAQLRSHYRHMEGILNEMVYTQLVLAEAKRSGDPGTVDDLEHRLLPPSPHRDCSWRCPMYTVCPMRDDGSAWASFMGENFQSGIIIGEEEVN